MTTTKEELNALKVEGLGVAGGCCVFTRVQKKEKSKDDCISGALRSKICASIGNKLDSANDLDRGWPYLIGRQILFLPTVNHSHNTKINLLELFNLGSSARTPRNIWPTCCK